VQYLNKDVEPSEQLANESEKRNPPAAPSNAPSVPEQAVTKK